MGLDPTGAVAAGAELQSQLLNAIATNRQNKKQRQWNEKMYGMQRADALADWERQNAYNSPAAQMQRLREAHLNPNLVYGHGADAQGGIVRATDVKAWNPQTPEFSGGSVMGQYLDAKVRQQQLDNLKTQQTLMEQEVKNKIANELKTYKDAAKSESSRDLIDTMVQIRGNELTYAPEMAATTLAGKRASIEKTIQDTKLSQANTLYRLSENERASIRLDQSLRESVARIANLRASALRAEAQTTTEYYKKQELMNQAILIEKRVASESIQQQIKTEELRIKAGTPDGYTKEYIKALQDILKGVISPGSYVNPKSTRTEFQRIQVKRPAYGR